jgi:hypothetical protein
MSSELTEEQAEANFITIVNKHGFATHEVNFMRFIGAAGRATGIRFENSPSLLRRIADFIDELVLNKEAW